MAFGGMATEGPRKGSHNPLDDELPAKPRHSLLLPAW